MSINSQNKNISHDHVSSYDRVSNILISMDTHPSIVQRFRYEWIDMEALRLMEEVDYYTLNCPYQIMLQIRELLPHITW